MTNGYEPDKIKVFYTRTRQPNKEYAATTSELVISTQDNLSLLLSDANLETSENRLIPAPMVSITPEIYYANDTPIGYTYNINLNGYATCLNINNGIAPSGVDARFQATLGAIKKVDNIFSDNNGIFLITDSGNNPILKANGCIVRGLNFEQNDNNWLNYAKYNVQLEANELEMGGCSGILEQFGCNFDLAVPTGIKESYSTNLLDMTKYRVKSFNDGWTFDINNSNMQNYKFDGNHEFNGDFIEVQYNISAVGKHYPKYPNGETEDNIHLRPAWQLAKIFCQDRLYKVVGRLIDSVLKAPDENALQSLFDSASTNGLFKGTNSAITNALFNVYNEEITFSASEAEGSFSSTYKCIIKRKNVGIHSSHHSTHTFKVIKDMTDDGEAREKTITVQGTIQGLMRGGLFGNGSNKITSILELPATGRLLSYNDPNTQHADGVNTKYKEALNAYKAIADTDGLNTTFKNILKITSAELGATCSNSPNAASHEVTHNYNTGSIDYSTVYTTSKACTQNNKVTSIKCSIEEPAPKIIQFVVPGKASGPVVQVFGDYTTPRTITITAEGYDKSLTCNPTISNPSGLLTNTNIVSLPTSITNAPTTALSAGSELSYNLIENNISYNRKDGSFSHRKKYTITNKKLPKSS